MKMTLKDLRLEKGVSQTRMGKEMRFTQATISHWELGKKTPRAENIKRLADYFGMSTREVRQAAINTVNRSEKREREKDPS